MKEPAHLALHPFGLIPTYEEGDLALFETGSIVFHIACATRVSCRTRPTPGRARSHGCWPRSTPWNAVAALLRGNQEVLRDFTDEEAGLLVDLLTRLIANLDRVASVDTSPGAPISDRD